MSCLFAEQLVNSRLHRQGMVSIPLLILSSKWRCGSTRTKVGYGIEFHKERIFWTFAKTFRRWRIAKYNKNDTNSYERSQSRRTNKVRRYLRGVHFFRFCIHCEGNIQDSGDLIQDDREGAEKNLSIASPGLLEILLVTNASRGYSFRLFTLLKYSNTF